MSIAKFLIEKGANVNAIDDAGATPLHLAKSAAAVSLLLKHGADVHAKDRWGQTPLLSAVPRRDTGIIQLLLQGGSDPNVATGMTHRMTSLSHACRMDSLEIIKLLLDHGSDVKRGSPLIHAAKHGHTAAVELLIEQGADVDAVITGRRITTALNCAVLHGHAVTAQALLANGAAVLPGDGLRDSDGSGLYHTKK